MRSHLAGAGEGRDMRYVWLAGAAIGLALGVGSPARAGLYDPRQPTSPLVSEQGVRQLPFELFKDMVDEIRNIGDPRRATSKRTEFLDRRAALVKRGVGSLSAQELVELAYVEQRLRQPDEALQTLRQALGRDPRSFWVQTQLGTIDQASNQYQDALPHLAAARDAFPDPWPGGAAAGTWFKQM